MAWWMIYYLFFYHQDKWQRRIYLPTLLIRKHPAIFATIFSPFCHFRVIWNILFMPPRIEMIIKFKLTLKDSFETNADVSTRFYGPWSCNPNLRNNACDSSANMPWCLPGRQDPGAMDGSRGHRLPQVHVCVRLLELWHRHVGGDVVRGATLLELVQPRRHQGSGEGLQTHSSHGT